MRIKNMILAAVVAFLVFALIGGGLCIWFSDAAVPAIRTIRNGASWTKIFVGFFYGGSVVSLLYTILMTYLGGVGKAYHTINWLINVLVTSFIGVILAVIFYIVAPTKDAIVGMAAAIAIFLQGFGIFFIASFFAPNHWGVYNPLKR